MNGVNKMEPEQFLEELSIFAQYQGGVQKLREIILQLAVRGKLVPQNPNDEPASVLFERIVAKVESLMALCDQLEQSQTAAMKLQGSYSLAEAIVN